ncbi:DNA polymerase II subunit B4 [Elaeis guineensis]|uniref:DNA polymerase epsilon subunit 3 n=1 Tax=Elaeis guineensis var. tenera TaxID=51953 RepID=A0A6I9RK74_ELAGV|nr:DNA polymerase epsilon subunit 3 [Elaeis guineensis]
MPKKDGGGGEGGAAPAPGEMAKKDGGGGEGGAAPAPTVEELPRAIVRRVVKDKLAELSSEGAGGGEEELKVHKDALLAFAESARIFIHYLSATANDICKESNRQTINAEDVIRAIEEIEFPEFIEPLRISLEDFRRKNVAKKSGTKAKETDRKRKLEQETPTQNGYDGTEGAAEEEDNGHDGIEGATEEDREGQGNSPENDG